MADFRTLVVVVVAHVVSATKLQTRVLVSTIQGHHWSGAGGERGVKQVPLLEVTDSRQFYDPPEEGMRASALTTEFHLV